MARKQSFHCKCPSRPVSMFFLILFVGILPASESALPTGWKACSKSSPEFNECLKQQMQIAIQTLARGVQELNIGPLEPFPIKDLALAVNSGFNLTMDSGIIDGFTKVRITQLECTPWTSLKVKLHADRMVYNFNYTATGNLFNIQVRSAGAGLITLGDVALDLNMTFSEFQKDGKTFLKVKDMAASEIPVTFTADFHPKGRGYDYRTMINKIVNDNWKELLEEQKKAKFQHSKLFYKEVISRILAKIPKADLDLP